MLRNLLLACTLLLIAAIAQASAFGIASRVAGGDPATFTPLSNSSALLLGMGCFGLAVYGKRRKHARES